MGWKIVKRLSTVALFMPFMAFAQWGDFGGMGGGMGGFGGFGGDQSGSGSMEYSEKFADVNYVGDGKTFHNLDIYLPKETKESYPVVIHTYGSAWSMNNYKGSADLNTICAGLLKAGFAVVTPNHRSASDAIIRRRFTILRLLFALFAEMPQSTSSIRTLLPCRDFLRAVIFRALPLRLVA